jgi:hypothetical protein
MSDHEENIGSAATRDLAAMDRLAQFYDPLQAIYWTVWQALAWVRDRDANTVLECSEPYRTFVGTFREIWRENEFSFETCRALASLWRAFEAGTLIATGIDATSGIRREIRPLEWCDLQLVGIGLAAPEVCRRESSAAGYATRDEPVFRELRVRREDILRAFPENVDATEDQAIPPQESSEKALSQGEGGRPAPDAQAHRVHAAGLAMKPAEKLDAGNPPVQSDLEAVLREALRENPKLTQPEALKIARRVGAIAPREITRAMHTSLGGSTKPGPPGAKEKSRGSGGIISRDCTFRQHRKSGANRGPSQMRWFPWKLLRQTSPAENQVRAALLSALLSLQRADRPTHQKHVAFLMPVAPSAFPGRCSTSSPARARSSSSASPAALSFPRRKSTG